MEVADEISTEAADGTLVEPWWRVSDIIRYVCSLRLNGKLRQSHAYLKTESDLC